MKCSCFVLFLFLKKLFTILYILTNAMVSLLAAAIVHHYELIQSHLLYQDFQMCKALKELRGLW